MKAQGIGVHKPEEIEEFGKHDLKVLSDILADKPFFFGDEPTNVSIMHFVFQIKQIMIFFFENH